MHRPRAQHGFAPKPLFWDVLLAHFRDETNSARLERAFLGSSCEQWLNGEFFQAIIAARDTVWVRPEKSKRDLVLYPSPEAETEGNPALIVETKVIYSPEYLTTQARKLQKLSQQLVAARTAHPSCVAVGLVVYFDYQYSSDGGRSWLPSFKKREPFLSRAQVLSLGLENAFGKTHARARVWTGDGPHELRMGGYAYRVDVKFEMVRAC